jgi:hypothetical protein
LLHLSTGTGWTLSYSHVSLKHCAVKSTVTA